MLIRPKDILKSIISRLQLSKKIEQSGFIENNYESNEEININFIGGGKPILNIGRGTYINGIDLYCWDSRIKIDIGRYCSIADKITVVAGGEHNMNWVSTYPFIPRWNVDKLYHIQQPRFKGDIKIGNDVWISNNVVILSGLTIADGTVIGAGSVVTKDVPPYSIAVGNPAKVINKRFSDEIIDKLLKIKWWDWDNSKIYENLSLFNNINDFIKTHQV